MCNSQLIFDQYVYMILEEKKQAHSQLPSFFNLFNQDEEDSSVSP